MAQFFQFEADFVESLRCIPMQVRLKLDTCGIKLKLPQWHRLSPEERQALVELPCTTASEVQAYRALLQRLVLERVGETATDLPVETNPAWMDATTVHPSVQASAHQEIGITITPKQWATLTPEQRFALIKLSRSNHENENFLPALKEFHLV
ncbi:MAG: nitrate reductase associated protein [Chroococcidiopsidaceae cyanobacterium CP_BM_RX_35]|nr:nitrate reductase associated protein [Chroococcidiopsidaceae cyanobacterium CP_BM_RX_35]